MAHMQTSQNGSVTREVRDDRSVRLSRISANGSRQLPGSFARKVAIAVTNAILDHSLTPGTKLCEQAMADVFGVSRTVARQAVILLAGEGLVTVERHRGAFVSQPAFEEALEVCESLVMIEQAAAAHLVRHLGETEWSEVKRRVAEGQRPEHPGTHWRDQVFYSLLLELTGNPVVQSIHARLLRRMELVRSLARPGADHQVLAERNAKMVDLLARGQFRQAAMLIERHRMAPIRSGYVERPHEMRPSDARTCLAEWQSRSPSIPMMLTQPAGSPRTTA